MMYCRKGNIVLSLCMFYNGDQECVRRYIDKQIEIQTRTRKETRNYGSLNLTVAPRTESLGQVLGLTQLRRDYSDTMLFRLVDDFVNNPTIALHFSFCVSPVPFTFASPSPSLLLQPLFLSLLSFSLCLPVFLKFIVFQVNEKYSNGGKAANIKIP